MQWSEQIDKIAPAFLLAQKEVKKAPKDGDNPHFRSHYATLSSVYDACEAALHKHGISVLQGARNEIDTYGVDTLLLHTSGQWIREILMLKPARPDPQGAGSAITYARRYAIAAMVGVMQDDDDANEASHKPNLDLKTAAKNGVAPSVSPKHIPIPSTKALDNPAEYVIPFGKYKGRRLREVNEPDLNAYCIYIAKTNGDKPMSPAVKEFMAAAEAHLFSESSPPPPNINVLELDQIPF